MFTQEGFVFGDAARYGEVADAGTVFEIARIIVRCQAARAEVTDPIFIVTFKEARGRAVAEEIAGPARPVSTEECDEQVGVR